MILCFIIHHKVKTWRCSFITSSTYPARTWKNTLIVLYCSFDPLKSDIIIEQPLTSTLLIAHFFFHSWNTFVKVLRSKAMRNFWLTKERSRREIISSLIRKLFFLLVSNTSCRSSKKLFECLNIWKFGWRRPKMENLLDMNKWGTINNRMEFFSINQATLPSSVTRSTQIITEKRESFHLTCWVWALRRARRGTKRKNMKCEKLLSLMNRTFL